MGRARDLIAFSRIPVSIGRGVRPQTPGFCL